MAKKDEILFEIFEELAEEMGGVVARGGIFTSYHPRLKTRIHNREAVLFFQKDRKEYYLCIRISHTFPILVVIKPRYRTFGIFRLDLNFDAERIEPSLPHPFLDHFIIKTNNVERCMQFIGSDVFLTHFQEFLSPGVLEKKFFEELQLHKDDRDTAGSIGDGGIGLENMDAKLEKITVPSQRCFFYPYIILDRRGAFLKVRFDHYHETEKNKVLQSGGMLDNHKKELKEVVSSYLNSLSGLLNER